MKKAWYLMVGTILIAGLFQSAQAQVPSLPEKEDAVVAKIGEKTITLKEVETRMRAMPVPGDLAEQRKKTVEQMVEEIIFYQSAVAEGMDKDEVIARKVEDYKSQMVVSAYKNKLRDKVAPASGEDAKAFYEKNKSRYVEPAQFKMSLIVVKTEEDAKEILGLLKQGKDFASLAKEKSLDEMTKTRGGELGWFSTDMPLPYFDQSQMKTLAALKKGEISPIIRTGLGFHIVKMDDIKPASQKSYDMVAEIVKSQYFEEELKKVEGKIRDDLKSQMKVEIYYDMLK